MLQVEFVIAVDDVVAFKGEHVMLSYFFISLYLLYSCSSLGLLLMAQICTVSPKRKYTLLSSRVLNSEGGQMESRGCFTHSIELVGVAHPLLFL